MGSPVGIEPAYRLIDINWPSAAWRDHHQGDHSQGKKNGMNVRRRFTSLAILIMMCIAGLAQAESIEEKLAIAKQHRADTLLAAREQLTKAIDARIKEVAKTGDLEAVKAIMAERSAYVEQNVLPDTTRLQEHVKVYHKSVAEADQKLIEAYEHAIREHTKRLEIAKATEVQNELKDFKKDFNPRSDSFNNVSVDNESVPIGRVETVGNRLKIIDAKFVSGDETIDITDILRDKVSQNKLALRIDQSFLKTKRSEYRSIRSTDRVTVRYESGDDEEKTLEQSASSFLTIEAPAQHSKTQSTIHGMVVTAMANGDLIGKSTGIIATIADTGDTNNRRQATLEGAYPGSHSALAGSAMTRSFQEAFRVVRVIHPTWQKGTIRVTFSDKYSRKDGGSAGAAFCILLLSMFEDFSIDPNLAMTGDVAVNGAILPVGGVAHKIRGGILDGKTVIAIPNDNANAMSDALILFPSNEILFGAQVFAIETLEQAVAVAREERAADLAEATRLYSDICRNGQDTSIGYVRRKEVKDQLQKIVELAPNHLSAQYALKYANGNAPKQMSRNLSLAEVFKAVYPLREIIWRQYHGHALARLINEADLRQAKSNLSKMSLNVHGDIRLLHRRFSSFVSSVQSFANSGTLKRLEDVNKKRLQIIEEMKRLQADREVLEALMREGA